MPANPIIGVLLHWIGGFAAGSFYVPYRGVKHWSWEVYWIVGGVVSWIVAPLLFAFVASNDLFAVLRAAPLGTLGLCYLFGILWGFGGLTFGLTMRFLGMSLGMAIALGFSAAFGTLLPPLVAGTLGQMLSTSSGLVTVGGVILALVGIAVVGMAGQLKEKSAGGGAIPEFNLKKGVAVAVFSGIMSSCFAYGLASGGPIKDLSMAAGTDPLMQGLPVLVVVLLGGFTTNVLWSVGLIIKNRTGEQFFRLIHPLDQAAAAGAALEGPRPGDGGGVRVPLLRNYLLCSLAGLIWYLQFYFYSQGEVQMGEFGFASWTLHMASIIIFSSAWGFVLKEWKGAGTKALTRLGLGLAILIGASAVIGLANLVDKA